MHNTIARSHLSLARLVRDKSVDSLVGEWLEAHLDRPPTLYMLMPSVMHTPKASTMRSGCQLKSAAVLLCTWPSLLGCGVGAKAKPPR